MNRHKWCLQAGLALVAAAGLTGCLKRTEKIRVARDGAVAIELEYGGDTADFGEGDALPASGGAWKIEVEESVKDDGKRETKLTGSAEFAPGAALPETYAQPGDADADLALWFPTSLTIERRADGTYYHFRRTYQARPWAYIDARRQEVMEDLKSVTDKKEEELTHEDRVQLVDGLLKIARDKGLAFAQEALARAELEVKQDGWLKTWEAVQKYFAEVNVEELAEMLGQAQAEQGDDEGCAMLAARAEQVEAEARQLLLSGLREHGGWSAEEAARYERQLERARKGYAISEDLRDESFEIIIEMPGRIVAANTLEREGESAAKWEFDGTALGDRAVEIMVTSVVPHAAAAAGKDASLGR